MALTVAMILTDSTLNGSVTVNPVVIWHPNVLKIPDLPNIYDMESSALMTLCTKVIIIVQSVGTIF